MTHGRIPIGAIVMAGLVLLSAGSRGASATLIAGYDFSHSFASGDMALNSTPFYIFDGAGSGIASNPPSVLHALETQDLSANNRDMWHENRAAAFSPPSSNVHPRYAISKVTDNGSGLSGVVTYGAALQTFTAGDNTSSTFANSEFTAAGFTIDAVFEVDRTTATVAAMPILNVNRIGLAILPTTAGADAGKLSFTITGTFGTSGLGKPVKSLNTILKTGVTRPTFDVRVIWEMNGAGTADDRLLMFLNGAHQDTQFTTLDLIASGNNKVLEVLGFGGGGSAATGVLLNSLRIYSGVPPTIVGLPEPTAGALLLAAGALLLRRRRCGR